MFLGMPLPGHPFEAKRERELRADDRMRRNPMDPARPLAVGPFVIDCEQWCGWSFLILNDRTGRCRCESRPKNAHSPPFKGYVSGAAAVTMHGANPKRQPIARPMRSNV